MRDINLLTRMGINNNLRLKIVAIIYIGVTLICIAGVAAVFCLLLIAPEMKAELPEIPKLERYLGLIMYTTCLIGLGVNLNAFAFQSLVREKSRGNIEALLATPLKVKDIWIARSLAIFLPGLVVAEILTLILMLAVNYIYFIPQIGFLLTPWMAISGFVMAPLIYLCLTLLVYLIGLTGKPATGNVIAQVFLPVFIALMINLIIRNILDITAWPFSLANICIASVIGIITLCLLPCLTRERIVLSR